MKEYIHAQFYAAGEDVSVLKDKLKNLGDDWRPLATYTESDDNFSFDDNPSSITVGGQIHSACATLIKLQDPFLADRMQVSYITNELKDKYRK